MLPEELYKRKHFGTPESVILIVVNYVIMAVAIEVFAMCTKINWFFWVITALLALYNYFNIRRNREEYVKNITIGYIFSLAGLVLMFVLFRMKAQPC
jgi:hypothetical protein